MIDSEFSDMDGSRNKRVSSSDNIVSEVCIDIRSYVDLPYEIISDIILRLPIEDIVRFKSVCQTWYNFTKTLDFISLQANKSALCQPQRILLVPQYRIDSLFLLDNEKCRKIPLKNLNLSSDYKVACCCNGLLCIASNLSPDKPVFIYNPITGECKELPQQDHKPFPTRRPLYGFAFDRFNNRYKVVCVYRPYYWEGNVRGNPVTMCEIITEGEDFWRKLEIPYQVQFSHGSQTVFLDDAFHWMINRDHPTSGSELILALEINSEKFHTLQLPPVKLPDALTLINFAGSLAFVELCTLLCSSHIWKIVSSETKDRWICKYTCWHVSKVDYCTVLGLIDRSLLYKASQYQLDADGYQCTDRPSRDQLGLYTPKKNESFLLKMHGSPFNFETVLFAPTLISPKAIYFPSKLMWNCRIFPKLVSRNRQARKRRVGRRGGRKEPCVKKNGRLEK